LAVEIVKYVCQKINLTIMFPPPSFEGTIRNYAKEFAALEDGISDVLTGGIPLLQIVVTSSFDATIPYVIVRLKIFVPCPKSLPGTEKILTTFSLSVWLSIGLVMLLTTAVFWCAGNGPYRSVCNEAHTYRSLSNCFQNVWSVFVGVSLPQQPTTSNLRLFFFLYVCFCFAISTVFQAFFVSYLVEPKYEKKLETIDELLHSDIVYGDHPGVNVVTRFVQYPEYKRFLEKKKLKEDCTNGQKCVKRMVTKRDLAMPLNEYIVDRVAREMGAEGVGKSVCCLDEPIGTGGVILLFKKGSPLLERFNTLMRRYLEAGLPEMCRRGVQHRASLKGGGIFVEAAGDVYFAFSVSHLMPAFVELLVGTVFSSVVFIGELIVNCLCKRRGNIQFVL